MSKKIIPLFSSSQSNHVNACLLRPDFRLGDVSYNLKHLIKAWRRAEADGALLCVGRQLALSGVSALSLYRHPEIFHESRLALEKLLDLSRELNSALVIGLPLQLLSFHLNCQLLLYHGRILALAPCNDEVALGFDPADIFLDFLNDASQDVLPQLRPLAVELEIHQPEREYFAYGPFRFFFHLADFVSLDSDVPLALVLDDSPARILPTEEDINFQLDLATASFQAFLLNSPAASESSSFACFDGSALFAGTDGRLVAAPSFKAKNFKVELNYRADRFLTELAELRPLELPPEELDDLLGNEDLLLRLEAEGLCSETLENNPPALEQVRDPFCRRADAQPFSATDIDNILNLQASALAQRVRHLGCRMVLGLSGGLDSAMALLCLLRTAKILKRKPEEAILAVSMPGPGSSERTRLQARALALAAAVDFREIPITEAVDLHLRALEHPLDRQDATYENAQARERTQILMDLANQQGAIVIGTGDLSEIALGWCTYNGDHMSMYNVNQSFPKTMLRTLLAQQIRQLKRRNPALAAAFQAVLDTPVSPELLPGKDGAIGQETERLIGPYELHDFFLWQFLYAPGTFRRKLRLAHELFDATYGPALVEQTAEIFIRRFFSQQFKRSAAPEGVTLGNYPFGAQGTYPLPADLPVDAMLRLFLGKR